MPAEILTTFRPTPLWLAGFLALVVGAALSGVGATMTWATVGFPGDLAGAADVPVKGTELWEGVAVLGIAAAALVAVLLSRVSTSGTLRSVLAAGVAVGGVVTVALASLDLASATDRFGGAGGLADIAQAVADRLGQPVDRVRQLLEQNFGDVLRVDVGVGVWLVLAGGALLTIAGALSQMWARGEHTPPGDGDAPARPEDVG
jgi:hypothetical protein